jgi:dTDP-4-amino-4,6-dideoxygalactose transaminase
MAEAATSEILSLPLYPELTDEQAGRVAESVRAAVRQVC